jgi:hypothetical protein
LNSQQKESLMVIRRIGPLSLAKLAGVLYAAIGLIVGAVFAAISAIGGFSAAAAQSEGAPVVAALFGVGAIVFFPLLYGGIGVSDGSDWRGPVQRDRRDSRRGGSADAVAVWS